jgi:hypothetical protein
MKKISALLIALLLNSGLIFAQDMITKKSSEDIKAKILEVTTTEIKYKKFEDQTGPTFSILKSDVLMVRYENGSKDVFAGVQSGTSDMVEKGTQDAINNYKGQNSGAGWTATTSILTSPVLGLIPAILCSSSEPDASNLNVADRELMKNDAYNRAYREQAHKTKKRKVWRNYGIGSAIWLGLILIL